MAKKFKAVLGPWVLVTPDPPPEESKGGIYLPQGNVEERFGYATAVVGAVGPGIEKYVKGKGMVHEHSGLVPGDRVFFRGFLKDANTVDPFEVDDDQCLLHQQDCLGIVED